MPWSARLSLACELESWWRATAAAATSGPIRLGPDAADPELFEVPEAAALFELACASASKNGSPKVCGTTPPSTISETSSIAAIEAHARATMIPVRSTIAAGVRRSSRLVLAEMPREPAYIVRQPSAAAGALDAVRLDDDVTELAEVAGQSLDDPAAGDERPVDLVAEHDRGEVLLRRIDVGEFRRTTARPAPTPAPACRSRLAGR